MPFNFLILPESELHLLLGLRVEAQVSFTL